jgi:hypothetical protein
MARDVRPGDEGSVWGADMSAVIGGTGAGG